MEKLLILALVAGIGLARAKEAKNWVPISNWNESYVKLTTCKNCKNYEKKYGKDFYVFHESNNLNNFMEHSFRCE